jgi:hypothetical protein
VAGGRALASSRCTARSRAAISAESRAARIAANSRRFHVERAVARGRGAGGAVDRRPLQEERRVAREPGRGEQHEEGDVGRARRDHRRDEPALAVPQQPDAPARNLGPRLDEAQRRLRVDGEVGGGAREEVARGPADAALVVAQGGDAALRQVVRDEAQRSAAPRPAVPVVRPRAGEQITAGKGPGPRGIVRVPASRTPRTEPKPTRSSWYAAAAGGVPAGAARAAPAPAAPARWAGARAALTAASAAHATARRIGARCMRKG